MRRGDIWWVDFDPARGGEIQKIRPAIIVSNDASNRAMNRLQVVPISTSVTKLYPCEARLILDGKNCKAMADQLTTVSKERLKGFMKACDAGEITDVERAIQIQLGLGTLSQ